MAEATVREAPSEIVRVKRRNFFLDIFIRLVKTKPLGFMGFIIVMILFTVGIFADWISPYGWNEIMLQYRLSPPIPGVLWLGADNVGRDLLSRIIFGARISMTVSIAAQAITLVLKCLIAIPSGYFGGKYDIVLQRFIDAWICFPALALYLTVMAVLGPGIWQVIVVLGVSGGIGATRVLRSAVMRVKEEQYFEAARAIGVPTTRIMFRHVFPNVFSIIIIQLAAGMGGVISAEASLSFLGLGIPPPFPSWGGMLSGSGRQFMMVAPWMMLWPGLALSAVVFGWNMLADALRDLVDPRLRGGLGRYGGMTQEQLQQLAQKKMTQTQKKAA
jgi:peptide/nickel transport system permease protein